MKGIKLQIGDYVFIKSPSGDTTLIKIAVIHQKKVGYHSTPNKLSWVRLNLLEPIPLTSEILEKNEFNKVPQPGCSNPYHWEFKEYEEGTDESLYCIKAYNNFFRGMRITIENYVDCNNFGKQVEHFHELQQALRLCVLDKLADNLKMEE